MDELTICERFKQLYQLEADIVAYAPGRVNIIGDHTDYNDGFVLPAAIDMGTYVVARKRDDLCINVIASDLNNARVSFSLESINFDERVGWSHYVKGVIQSILSHFDSLDDSSKTPFENPFNESIDSADSMQGCDLLISGNIPQGAGLSSSASLEIALIKAISQLYKLPMDGIGAALIGQQAENVYVGCNCGIMDQLISALGQDKQAMLLDCNDLSYRYVTLDKSLQVLVINSNVQRQLVGSEYNDRREQCSQAAQFFNQSSLRHVSMQDLEAAKGDLPELLFKRARHVIQESSRTLQAFEALTLGDIAKMSQLMHDSHASLRDDFEVTTVEVDYLVNCVSKVIGSNGGVRMTGGGFGGCIIALVPHGLVDAVKTVVERDYLRETGLKADIYTCSVKAGAFSF
ncbi:MULTISPECIES: galactokinase [unclassified Shewanella]|uniref:galactokinase n=1 Tax=unclassified Shewanella TaxID=196818 RepID=UPI001BB83B18|nr:MULTISPECIES: galactokinase [unclassified Shewanella]GIU08567.1 galactokinase [Shewanella sp. MBTL60-112-B1]GIU38393.1 galactokinase [Shewanella sp. MBTL60-112-B2]